MRRCWPRKSRRRRSRRAASIAARAAAEAGPRRLRDAGCACRGRSPGIHSPLRVRIVAPFDDAAVRRVPAGEPSNPARPLVPPRAPRSPNRVCNVLRYKLPWAGGVYGAGRIRQETNLSGKPAVRFLNRARRSPCPAEVCNVLRYKPAWEDAAFCPWSRDPLGDKLAPRFRAGHSRPLTVLYARAATAPPARSATR
jgi:hypothetical protein